MSAASRAPAGEPSPAVVQQTIAWMVRLQSGNASPAAWDGCRRWREAAPEHALAWERLQGIRNRFSSMQLELSTQQGALRLQGQGRQLVGRWRFQGQAQAESGQYPVLANILNLIGNRSGDIAWNVLRSPAS